MAPFTPQFLKSAQKRILVFCASFFLVFSLVLPLKTVDANALLSGYVISRPEFTLTDETLEKVFASVVADMPDWFSYYNYALYNLGTTTFGYNLKLVLYPRSSVSLVARCATNNCVPTWGSISLYETLSSSANTGYEYRFSSGGTFVSKITLNNAAGVFNTFAYGTAYSTMPYYTSFTDFAFYYSNKTPANFNGSAVDYGAKEIPAHLSHAAYNRVGLVPGPEIPREGLVSMFDWIYSRPGYGSALSQNYYLILPEYSSGIITGWTVYLFPINSGDDMANYFMMIDSDTNNYLESIKLRFDGRVRPAMRILFDTQFNYIQSSSAGSLEEFEFSKVPVSYTNMPAYFQYGFEYFEPSDETFAILNGRLLPADLFDDLLVPVSFNLGTGLSDDFVFNIFKAALEVYPEVLNSYYYTISGGGPGNESGYVLELYPKINASTVYKGYMNEAGIIYRLELDINGIASGWTYSMNSLGVFTGSTELLSPLSHSVSGLTVYYTNIPLDVVHDDGYSVPNNVAAPLVNMAPRLPDSIREAIENYVPTDIMLSHAMHFFDDTTLTDMLVPVAEFASDNDEKVDTRPYLLIRNNIDTPNKATLIYFDLDSVEIHGILTQFGYVGAWYLVETKPSNSLLFEYSYNPSTNWIKNYHHYEQPDDKMRIYAESVYYTSGIPCYTVSQSGVKTSVDCSAYGAKSFPQSVLDNLDELESDPFNRVINTLLRIPAMIGKFVYDFTLGPVVDFFSSVIADNTVGNIWTSYLLIAESFFVLPGHLGDVMMALPDEIRVLFQSILVISFSLFAYKLYRVIRGLLI